MPLHNTGIRLGACTNKSEGSACAVLRGRKLMPPIEDVAGPDTFGVQKPDPEYLLRLLHIMRVDPRQPIYVGDSIHDVEMTCAACIPVAVVNRGYSTVLVSDLKADFILKHFSDPLEIATA